jgi:hypothetical protein
MAAPGSHPPDSTQLTDAALTRAPPPLCAPSPPRPPPRPRPLQDLEAFLTQIYRALAAATPLKDKVNVLTYFETLCVDTTSANVLINSSLTMLFVRMLRNSRAPLLRVRLASVLGLLVRHATFIAEELAATQARGRGALWLWLAASRRASRLWSLLRVASREEGACHEQVAVHFPRPTPKGSTHLAPSCCPSLHPPPRPAGGGDPDRGAAGQERARAPEVRGRPGGSPPPLGPWHRACSRRRPHGRAPKLPAAPRLRSAGAGRPRPFRDLSHCLLPYACTPAARVMATLGELLFYIATQQQDGGGGSVSDVSAAWGITSATLSGVARLLKPGEDEICTHYAAKTIENICSQGGEWAAIFSTQVGPVGRTAARGLRLGQRGRGLGGAAGVWGQPTPCTACMP